MNPPPPPFPSTQLKPFGPASASGRCARLLAEGAGHYSRQRTRSCRRRNPCSAPDRSPCRNGRSCGPLFRRLAQIRFLVQLRGQWRQHRLGPCCRPTSRMRESGGNWPFLQFASQAFRMQRFPDPDRSSRELLLELLNGRQLRDWCSFLADQTSGSPAEEIFAAGVNDFVSGSQRELDAAEELRGALHFLRWPNQSWRDRIGLNRRGWCGRNVSQLFQKARRRKQPICLARSSIPGGKAKNFSVCLWDKIPRHAGID